MDHFMKYCFENYLSTQEGQLEIVRDDGHVSIDNLNRWVRKDYEICKEDKWILDKISAAPVLDIGCGSGVHMRYLQKRLDNVFGCDYSQWTVERAEMLGTQNVFNISFWDFPEEKKFANIICMNGTIGFIGEISFLDAFFQKVNNLIIHKGNLYIQGVDWRIDEKGIHKNYIEKNIQKHIYPGQVMLSLRYKNIQDKWFKWVWIDTDTLWNNASKSGFRIVELIRSGAKYLMVLQKQ